MVYKKFHVFKMGKKEQSNKLQLNTNFLLVNRPIATKKDSRPWDDICKKTAPVNHIFLNAPNHLESS